MYEDLRERAIQNLETRRKKERTMQVIGVIFGSVAVLLFGVSRFMYEADQPYMFIPIGILGLVYLIIYTAVLGLPFTTQEDISETEIEQELIKIYRRYKHTELADLSEEEALELRQIEYLLNDREDYV